MGSNLFHKGILILMNLLILKACKVLVKNCEMLPPKKGFQNMIYLTNFSN